MVNSCAKLFIKWLRSSIRETILEFKPAIIKQGIEVEKPIEGKWVTLEEWEKTDEKKRNPNLENEMQSSTIELGRDSNVVPGECKAEWVFDIDKERGKDARKNLYNITLVIRCIRPQAGLHAETYYNDKFGHTRNPNPFACISIFINGKEAFKDKLVCNSKMPYGKDFGFGNRVEYNLNSLIEKLRKNGRMTVTLKVNEFVYWDIDFLNLEIVTEKRRFKSWVPFVVGLILSPLVNLLLSPLWERGLSFLWDRGLSLLFHFIGI